MSDVSGSAEVRALRSEIRHWRRGRADARLVDVIGDFYIGIFATLMLGSMLANVVINVGRVSDDLCRSSGCREGRSALPWLVALAALTAALAIARLFGPVYVTPATASWLLPTPVDRVALLRPRLIGTVLVAAIGAGLVTAIGTILGGFAAGPVAAYSGAAALLAIAAVCLAAVSQAGAGLLGRTVTWLLAALVWAGLLVLALDSGPHLQPRTATDVVTWVVLAIAVAAALAAIIRALRGLPRLRDRDVAPGGALAPGLSGALASLDLALLFDVLLAHRWNRRATVRPIRRKVEGPAALAGTDVTRLRRSPQVLVVLAAGVVVPYAVATAGGGRVVLLVAPLVGFVAGLPLLVGLRVLTRTPALLRMLPFGVAETRRMVLRVPGTLLVLFGLACAPAVADAVPVTGGEAMLLGIAIGLAGLAAATRWVTGRPPDYTRPLVSTPAGGVPTNLYGSAVRGFDVLLLTTAPLLISPGVGGAEFSAILSLIILGYLTARK